MLLIDEPCFSVATTSPLNDDGDATEISALMHNDRDLVAAAQLGCRTAFNKLWDLYSQRVYRTIIKITRNREDAEDALQDSFFRAFQCLAGFEGRSSFYSWITRIAVNSALGILRKRRSRSEVLITSMSSLDRKSVPEEIRELSPGPEDLYAQYQKGAILARSIRGLPKKLREAVQLRFVENLPLKEVAFLLHISEAAAKSRLSRARAPLSTTAIHRTASPLSVWRDRGRST
jgi:RNA polymerase sigma-70 factor, ECF subfamily